jgi:ubiquinone/menaquinone biosynthesis C-methylase UbiE
LNLSESYDGIAAEMWDYMGGDTPGADFEFYARKIRQNPGKALDLTCGSGKHLLRYLKMGLDVEGVDASGTMLSTCRQKAEYQGLKPVLYQQCMQSLNLPCKYQTIFLSAGSFQLLGDRDEAKETLRRCYAHLNPGGQLLFETFLPDEAFQEEPSTQVTVWGPTLRPRDGAAITTHLWTESADRFEQVKVEKRRYEATKDGQIIESELHTMTLRWYFKYEMIMMLEQAGFRDIFIYGNYTESAATALSSETVYGAKR